MSTANEQIEQTAKRLAEVEALQQTLASVQQELRDYQDLLSQKLALLRESRTQVIVPAADDDVILPVADEDWGDLPQAAPAAEPAPPKAIPLPPLPRPAAVTVAEPGKSIPPRAAKATPPVPAPLPVKGIPVPSKPPKNLPPTPVAAPEPAKGIPVPPTAKPAKGIPVRPAQAGAPPPSVPQRGSPAKDTIHSKAPPARAEPELAEDAGPRGERRAAPRRGGNPKSVQISNADGESLQGWVVDRSSGGVRLLVDQALDIDTVLSLRPTNAHPSVGWIQVRVKSCRPERNSFNIGCEFVNKLSWSELQVFG